MPKQDRFASRILLNYFPVGAQLYPVAVGIQSRSDDVINFFHSTRPSFARYELGDVTSLGSETCGLNEHLLVKWRDKTSLSAFRTAHS